MPEFTVEDLVSAVSGMPNENMVLNANAMGADPLPKRHLSDLTHMGQAAIPPWLIALLAGAGFRGRGGRQVRANGTTEPRTEISGIVRSHFGQDRAPQNPRSQIPSRNELVTQRSFPGTPTSGPQDFNPNMRVNSFNDIVEALHAPMDRLANRRVLTPANITPAEAQNQQTGQARRDMTNSIDLIRDILNKPPTNKD